MFEEPWQKLSKSVQLNVTYSVFAHAPYINDILFEWAQGDIKVNYFVSLLICCRYFKTYEYHIIVLKHILNNNVDGLNNNHTLCRW